MGEVDLSLIQPKKHAFEVGKVFSALVIGSSSENRLLLNINNQQVSVKTPHTFLAGEELKLKVVENDKQVVLQVQNHQLSQSLLNQSLRAVLPNQMPMTPVLNAVKEVSHALNGVMQKLPESVVQQLKVINNVIPSLTQLTQSQGLKQAIQNSGIFLENKLLNLDKLPATKDPNIQALPPTIIKDIKHQLLTFLKNINSQLTKLEQSQASVSPPIPPTPTTASAAPQDPSKLSLPPLSSTTLPPQIPLQNHPDLKLLELSAKLQRAAELIRTSVSKPLLQPSPEKNPNQQATDPKGQPQTQQNQQQAAQANTANQIQLSAYQQLTQTKHPANFMKHASLPLSGATPQPIKNDASPLAADQNPKQLLQNLKEGVSHALSRLQANQLSTLIKHPLPLPTFLLDIPVNINDKQTELIPFLIKEEEPNAGEDEENGKKHWSMMLALDMDNLGPMQVKVSLNHDKVNVSIWSDSADTKTLFESKDKILKLALMAEQLSIGNIAYHQGLQENNIDKSTINLLDLKI